MLLNTLRSRRPTGRRRKPSDQGFTLVELLVVITILGILAAVVIAAVSGIGDKGEDSARKTDATIQATAQEAYCSSENGGKFEDPLILQREGFLSSASGYTDVELNRSANTENCEGTSFAIFSPKKTEYPVTVTGCHGTRTTFETAPPAKPIALTQSAHELFAHLGLTGNAKVPYVQNAWLRPVEHRVTMQRDFERNPGSDPAGVDPLSPGYQFLPPPASARHVVTLPSLTLQDIDFAFTDRPEWLPRVIDDAYNATRGGTSADYTEAQAIASKPGGLKTYVGFAHGGCSVVLDKNFQGEPLPRTSLEGIFADIRNIGIIFDKQQEAADLIAELKANVAKSLFKAGPGAGLRVAVLRTTNSNFSGTGVAGLQASLGSNAAAGYINLAGGVNVFGADFTDGISRKFITAQELVDARPDIIVIGSALTGPRGDTIVQEDCGGAYTSVANFVGAANLALIPAFANFRIVCGGGAASNPSASGAVSFIDRIANELALGATFSRDALPSMLTVP
ncbi:MAG: prepilin-type N-terminal cleavage/methylation domain-containing protein [Sporichthyaceae bacterium]